MLAAIMTIIITIFLKRLPWKNLKIGKDKVFLGGELLIR